MIFHPQIWQLATQDVYVLLKPWLCPQTVESLSCPNVSLPDIVNNPLLT